MSLTGEQENLIAAHFWLQINRRIAKPSQVAKTKSLSIKQFKKYGIIYHLYNLFSSVLGGLCVFFWSSVILTASVLISMACCCFFFILLICILCCLNMKVDSRLTGNQSCHTSLDSGEPQVSVWPIKSLNFPFCFVQEWMNVPESFSKYLFKKMFLDVSVFYMNVSKQV